MITFSILISSFIIGINRDSFIIRVIPKWLKNVKFYFIENFLFFFQILLKFRLQSVGYPNSPVNMKQFMQHLLLHRIGFFLFNF